MDEGGWMEVDGWRCAWMDGGGWMEKDGDGWMGLRRMEMDGDRWMEMDGRRLIWMDGWMDG